MLGSSEVFESSNTIREILMVWIARNRLKSDVQPSAILILSGRHPGD